MQDTPIRLTYRLTMLGRGQGAQLSAHEPERGRLDESSLKRLVPRLHMLDAAIARELFSASSFGQLGDAQLAKLLPLLAQRQTKLGENTLRIDDVGLVPRVRLLPGSLGGLRLSMYLADKKGGAHELTDGRLISGSQAFFVRDTQIASVESPAPWDLASWAKNPILELGAELNPQRRDELVRQLKKVGVPEQDVTLLAVQRMPPERFVVHLVSHEAPDGLEAHVVLEAEYQGERAVITGREPDSPYVVQTRSEGTGLIERDLAAEMMARTRLNELGFRFDNTAQRFVARGETSLRALDPKHSIFPRAWLVDRSGNVPIFRQDLKLTTQVKLLEERGLLQLDFGVQAESDEETIQALVEMQDLLRWLESGQKYVRLKDGSYVAPSQRFRDTLMLAHDLGTEADRVLVSPLCVGILKAMGERDAVAAADAATQAWLAEVSGAEEPKPVEPPSELTTVLRDYQKRGLEWMAMLHRHRLTGILADDMGLGKTLQTLTLLLKVRNEEGQKPSLVVAPTSVIGVWRDEAARFAPSLKIGVFYGDPDERKRIDIQELDVLVTSYGILRRDAEYLKDVQFRYVILDEAQSAKNSATQNAKSIRMLKSERRLALTGTPIENRPEELWATFDFLAPGFLGNQRAFRKRYARPIERGEEPATFLLRSRIQPLVLRRMKDDVAKELPPKIESVIRCEMSPAQRALYDHVAGELKDSVQQRIAEVGIQRAHLDILAALTRLRQICCDPALLPVPDRSQLPDSAKLQAFEELMREALASERRIVVFSQFVEMQKRLISVVKKLGVDPLWLHGGTKDRDKVVAAFQDPSGPPVIIVSLKAGGTGVTLTRADTVLHYDPWWNPAVERQATDRAHRLGQQHQVSVYKLVCTRSIEERVLAMAQKKDELANQLLGSDGTGSKRITTEQILELIG